MGAVRGEGMGEGRGAASGEALEVGMGAARGEALVVGMGAAGADWEAGKSNSMRAPANKHPPCVDVSRQTECPARCLDWAPSCHSSDQATEDFRLSCLEAGVVTITDQALKHYCCVGLCQCVQSMMKLVSLLVASQHID